MAPDSSADGSLVATAVNMDEARALKAAEDLPDPDEVILALEELVAPLPAADPGQPGPGVDVEDEDQVGGDGESLVHPPDPADV